jgi:hypothetical protein
MNHRMMPPTQVAYQTRTVNGRSYTGVPGSVQDIPDFDAEMLSANGWTFVALSGPTSGRPVGALGKYAATRGVRFYDTTISTMCEFDGVTWRDPSGSAV